MNKFYIDEENYICFKKMKGVNFRILQLTDVHIGGGVLSITKDRLALNAVRNLVKATSPDLVIVTGDISYPIPIFSGTINNLKSATMFASVMDSLGVPWTIVFGNHDYEPLSTHTKEQLREFYSSIPTCVFKSSAQRVTGDSNYVLKLVNSDNSINTLLMCLDSNAYTKKGFFSGFDKIHDDQVEWYKSEIIKISKYNKATFANYNCNILPSLAFFHIPPREFRKAWWALQEGNKSIVYNFGALLEKDQYFGVPNEESIFFDEMVKLKSLKGFFCGHDHLNTLSLTYQGIQMTYGMSIDYLAYNGISKAINQRGGTLIEIDDESNFVVTHKPLYEVCNTKRGGLLKHNIE